MKNRLQIIANAIVMASVLAVSSCALQGNPTPTGTGTEVSVESSVVSTATPTPTRVPLGEVITLEIPATYAALFDGTKVYTDATRSTVLKVLRVGDLITITGTCDGYGVTAERSYVNLILMAVVVVTTPTPSPTPTSATTEPTTSSTTVPTTKPTTSPIEPKPTSTPKPTTTTKPTPTPKPTSVPVTPAPTTAPVATLSAAEVEALVWTQVESARSGFTTNHTDVLSTRCRKSAARFVISHSIPNGSLESCGGIAQRLNGEWTVELTAGYTNFASLTDAVNAMSRELVTDHVPLMSTTAEYTEFGVGVAKQEPTAAYPLATYYVYISCTDPSGLQHQIDRGWYD